MKIDDPLSWLLKADRDINVAKLVQFHTPDTSDLICYHCPQAGEKYLKALVIHYQIPLRKTHDLEELLDLLRPFEPNIDDKFHVEAIKLNFYAVGIRYPSPSDPTETEVREALSAAEFF